MCENPSPTNVQLDARDHHVEPVKQADRADDGTHTNYADPERVRLTGWSAFDGKVRAHLMGELIKKAVPVTEQYLSDLYHDVHWIDKYVNGDCTFYFTARSYGTFIGSVPHFGVDGYETFHNYVVTVEGLGERDDKEWFAIFERVDANEESVAPYREAFELAIAQIATERRIADEAVSQ